MNRPRTLVLAAVSVVVALAAALGVRWAALGRSDATPPARPLLQRMNATAPSARVPAPVHVDVPKVPCWSCPESEKWPIRFQTDLDVLAPLGDGPANAALWFKDFSKPEGARLAEAEAATRRRVEGPAGLGLVLPPGDPLLKEAGPWADQATMRFYPDVWTAEGASTPIPNLLVALTLSRSWAARAASNPDAPSALEDCRRAIRWGRLLRQEDATIIQDLVGLASIRMGADQLYALAARRGEQSLMLAAAIVLGEAAPQRLRTAEAATRFSVWPREVWLFGAITPVRPITDGVVEDLVAMAKSSPDRRLRSEAIVGLAFVRLSGTSAQRQKSEKTLDEMRALDDAFLSGQARWALALSGKDAAGMTGVTF